MFKIKIKFDKKKHITCEQCGGQGVYGNPKPDTWDYRCDGCRGLGFRRKTWTEMIIPK
jgi:DnaJ-class molecular chaperone